MVLTGGPAVNRVRSNSDSCRFGPAAAPGAALAILAWLLSGTLVGAPDGPSTPANAASPPVAAQPTRPGPERSGAPPAIGSGSAADAQSATTPPVEFQPCRVRLRVGFDGALRMDRPQRETLLRLVRDGIERYAGEFWHAEVLEDASALCSGTAAINRLRSEDIPRDAAREGDHKVYFLAVEAAGAAFRVVGREWDVQTTDLSPVARERVYEPREIAEAILTVVRGLYRPVAEIEPTKQGTVILKAHGGGFTPRDDGWTPLAAGRVFEAYYRYFNKDRAVERIQQVPWTYLVVGQEVENGAAPCTIASGLRGALAGRRRRVQAVALGINRKSDSSRVTLVTRPPAKRPLAGVEVELSRDPLPPAPEHRPKTDNDASAGEKPSDTDAGTPKEKKPEPAVKLPRLVADRNGRVEIGAGLLPADGPIWLFVHSGQALLARVPFVPGAHRQEILELPDDSLRLEVEGNVALLQAELVDTVARRAVLMALARSRARAGEFEAADEYLTSLAGMSQPSVFTSELSALRITSQKAARAQRDRMTELRIQKLCDETAELIAHYLDEDKLRELRDEIAELRQIATEDAVAEAKFKEQEANPTAKKSKKKSSGKKGAGKKAAPKATAPAGQPAGPPVGF